jgi:hypothetical protein
MFWRCLVVADKDERRVATIVTLHGLQTSGGLVPMIVKCAMCGFKAEVENPWLCNAPIQAFFEQRPRRDRLFLPDVWICDTHK